MKKIVLAFVALAGMTAFGAIDVAFSNIVGVVRVMSTNHYTLVSVPFGAVGMDLEQASITLEKLVQLVNLGRYDRMELYSEEGDMMNAWQVNRKGVWAPVNGVYIDETGKEIEINLKPADEQRVDRGWAMRIYRNTPTDADGNALPIYLIGQYDQLHGERKLRKGNWITPRKSLVSFPGIRQFDLDTIQEGVFGDNDPAAKDGIGDEIDLITDGSPITYRYRDGHWCYQKTTVTTVKKNGKKVSVTTTEWVAGETLIPQGTGFWYKSRGGEPVIRW